MDFHADLWVREIVNLPDEILDDDRVEADHLAVDCGHRPRHFRHIARDAAIDMLLIHVDDFRTASLPPHLRGRYLLAVV